VFHISIWGNWSFVWGTKPTKIHRAGLMQTFSIKIITNEGITSVFCKFQQRSKSYRL